MSTAAITSVGISKDVVQPVERLGFVERCLLGIMVFEIPIQVDTYLFFDEKWAQYGAIGGINLSITTVCLVALYLLWMIEHTVAAGYPWRERLRFSVPLTAYLAIATISVMFSENRQLAINAVALLLQAYLIFFFVSNRIRSRDDVVFLSTLLMLALVMQAVIIIALQLIGHDVHIGPIQGTIKPDLRPEGTIGSANSAASFLVLLMAPALGIATAAVGRSLKWLALLAFSLASVALLLTLSRGGWLGAGVSLTLFCLLAMYQRRISIWAPLTVLLFTVLVIGVYSKSISERLTADDGGAAQARIPLIQAGFRMIGDHPVTGVGVNNSTVVGWRYAMQPEFRTKWFYTIHNKYLLEWVELGFLGLGTFLWFLFSTMRTGWKTWQTQDALLATIALGFTVAFIGQMLHMFVDVFNARPQVQMLWLCAGLVVAMYAIQREAVDV
jgi:putative inorganic carbon (HCO3(-)) transporter